MIRIGRIPYINCYPVYRGIDRGVVPLDAELVSGVPTQLNALMASGTLDVSVVSAIEYARDSERYFLLPDLAISCDGPVRSVLLLSKYPAGQLGGRTVMLSRSSMTSAALLELLFAHVWGCEPVFVAGDAEVSDIQQFMSEEHSARLVIGDAALQIAAGALGAGSPPAYPFVYDLGQEWKSWTGKPFVFAVWVAQRTGALDAALAAHAALIASRNWGIENIPLLAEEAAGITGVPVSLCTTYLSGLDYRLSYPHLAALTEFFSRLEREGRVPPGQLSFLPAA